MRTLQLFVSNIALTTIFVFTVFAQAEKTLTEASKKIVKINSENFSNEKTGIKDLAMAYNRLDVQLKPEQDELKVLSLKLMKMEKELLQYSEILRKEGPGCRENIQSEATTKFDEYEKSLCEFRQKEYDYKVLLKKRDAEIVNPVIGRIRGVLEQFKKEKGYVFILDSSKNSQGNFTIEGDLLPDVTIEFVQFYNSSVKP